MFPIRPARVTISPHDADLLSTPRRPFMHSLHWSPLALLLLSSTLPAQTRSVAERLGYPADAKLLILHGDDLGVAHSVNVASLDALSRGDISSASIMMPTPWVTEVAEY